ncbi:hypothetical protein [Peribacillus simplex]
MVIRIVVSSQPMQPIRNIGHPNMSGTAVPGVEHIDQITSSPYFRDNG